MNPNQLTGIVLIVAGVLDAGLGWAVSRRIPEGNQRRFLVAAFVTSAISMIAIGALYLFRTRA